LNPLSRAIEFFRKRRAIRQFLRRLPSLLKQDYGHRGPYMPDQVASTVNRYRVASNDYLAFAMAMFCSRENVESIWLRQGLQHDFDKIRTEIGTAYFAGDPWFTYQDVQNSSEGMHGGDGAAHSHSETSGSGGSHHH
jgi:hypothetical protein